jgi:hypothetical protein
MLQSPADAQVNKNRLKMVDKGGWVEGGTEGEDVGDAEEAEDISQNPAFGPVTPSTPTTPMTCQSHTKSETRAGNNLYQELSFQDGDALADIDEGADLTGNYELELNIGLHQHKSFGNCKN